MSKKLKKHAIQSTNPKKKNSKEKGASAKKASAPRNEKNLVKEISIFLYYLIMPSALVTLSTLVISYTDQVWLAMVYLITLASIILFFVFRFHHCKFKNLALLLGLALSPLLTFIHDARTIALADRIRETHDIDVTLLLDRFPYFNAILAFFFYMLPFLFIAGVTLAVTSTLRARNHLLNED